MSRSRRTPEVCCCTDDPAVPLAKGHREKGTTEDRSRPTSRVSDGVRHDGGTISVSELH